MKHPSYDAGHTYRQTDRQSDMVFFLRMRLLASPFGLAISQIVNISLQILCLRNRTIDAIIQFQQPSDYETTLEDDLVKNDITTPVQSYSSTQQRDLGNKTIDYIEPMVNVEHCELPIESATEFVGETSSYDSITSVCVHSPSAPDPPSPTR